MILLGNTAFAAAVVTAAVSFIGWIATRLYTLVQERAETDEMRRVAFVQFYTDVRLRAKFLPFVLPPSSVAIFEATIRDYGARDEPLRFYGVQVSDQRSFERMNDTLHRLSSEDADEVSEYMQFDRLFVIQYEKLQSETFERLSVERKIAALRDCALSARELQDIAERLKTTMSRWPEMKRWLAPRAPGESAR